MPSQALQDLTNRLRDVQQLIDAHEALTRLRRAEASLRAGGNALGQVAEVVRHLVTQIGPGRPQQVHALNNAGVALLSAHLQGFIVDLFHEAAASIFAGRVESIAALVGVARTRGNPNPNNIKGLFCSIGFENVLDGIAWQKMDNASLLRKLQDFNALRNRIVHGSEVRVTKYQLNSYLNTFKNFAEKLDAKLSREIHRITGVRPW